MLTLYNQEQATQMMLANERKSVQIQTAIEMYQEFGKSLSDVVAMLGGKFGLSEAETNAAVNQYWKV